MAAKAVIWLLSRNLSPLYLFLLNQLPITEPQRCSNEFVRMKKDQNHNKKSSTDKVLIEKM